MKLKNINKSLVLAGSLFLLLSYDFARGNNNSSSIPKMAEQSLSVDSGSFSLKHVSIQERINDVVRYLQLKSEQDEILELIPIGDRKIFVFLKDNRLIVGITKKGVNEEPTERYMAYIQKNLDIAFEDHSCGKSEFGEIDYRWHYDSDTKSLIGEKLRLSDMTRDTEKELARIMYSRIINLFYKNTKIDVYLKNASDLERTLRGYKNSVYQK